MPVGRARALLAAVATVALACPAAVEAKQLAGTGTRQDSRPRSVADRSRRVAIGLDSEGVATRFEAVAHEGDERLESLLRRHGSRVKDKKLLSQRLHDANANASCTGPKDCASGHFCKTSAGHGHGANASGHCRPCHECSPDDPDISVTGDCHTCMKPCTDHAECVAGSFCKTNSHCGLCMDCHPSSSIDGNCTACEGFCASHAGCGEYEFCDKSHRCRRCGDCSTVYQPYDHSCTICAGDDGGCTAHAQCEVGEFCGADGVCWGCSACAMHPNNSITNDCAPCSGSPCSEHDHCGLGSFCSIHHTCLPCHNCTGVPVSSITGTCDICDRSCASTNECVNANYCDKSGECRPCSECTPYTAMEGQCWQCPS